MKKPAQALWRLATVDGVPVSTGYRSGRSSVLGTPDTDSTSSTRSAGIRSAFRHFCTAWYRTPHLRANSISPPPPEIARSIALMPPNLQPIVAVGQQSMRASESDTMQPMVDTAKEAARAAWSEWLNSVLDQKEVPRRGRPGWLRQFLKSNGLKVSYETCRKWLAGLDLPDRANEAVLCKSLEIGRQPADIQFAELTEIWDSLPPARKEFVLATAKMAQAASTVEQKPSTVAKTPHKRRGT